MRAQDSGDPPRPPRVILHVDLDAFYASVEQRDNPTLRGRPVVVGGSVNRGVVSAASYEARKFGIHSAMPMAEAVRRCRHLVVVPGRMGLYVDISRKVREIFHRYTPQVEPLSLDEAFLDVTGSAAQFEDGVRMAREIRAVIQAEVGLTASAGVAANKLVAKMASDMRKPDGLTVVESGQEAEVLAPMPVGALWGIGPRTGEGLERRGIRTLGDLQRKLPPSRDPADLQDGEILDGIRGELIQRAFGLDARPVGTHRERKSMSSEHTFDRDLDDGEYLRNRVRAQAEAVARRLRVSGLRARTVTLTVRTTQRSTHGRYRLLTRSRTRPAATEDGMVLYRTAIELLDALDLAGARVRLVGVGASSFVPSSTGNRQGRLFEETESGGRHKLHQALDRITHRYGKKSIVPASTLEDRNPPEL